MPTNYLPKQAILPGHYVYEHCWPDTGQPFYIGAGTEGRAWAMWGRRNPEHWQIVRELRAIGLEPIVRIVEQGLTKATAHRHEHALIGQWRQCGVILANYADLPDRNARRSARLKGRVFSAATRAKMSAAKKGKKQSAEMIAARSAGMIGHKVSAATGTKIAAANRGRRRSAEQRARMSQAQKMLGKNRQRNARGQYMAG
jgi:hypothetical protein